jgi:hypothetical protein
MYKKMLLGNLAALFLAGALSPAHADQQQVFGYTNDDEHEELIATPNASSGSCGVERWSVKTGTDADINAVNINNPVIQTITYLRSLTAPSTLPANNRVAPTEDTVFVVDATLMQYKLETDSDYHLVIQDASGNTMIAEIPDPACVGAGSPFASYIQTARAQFDAKYSATTSFQTANIPVQITGVGFFDFLHGQTGVAPNGIELHSVLDIQFNPGSGGQNFALSASPGTVSAYPGASATSTITETPSGGFTGSVALSASGLPTGVTASFSPSSTTGTSTLTLNVGSAVATGTYAITVKGTSGTLSHTTTVNLTVLASTGGGQTAVYNSTLKAPGCSSVASSCDSGPSLLLGRASISGGAEPNQPNTINNSCADGTSGTFHSSESNDRLVIASADGGPLTAGKSAKITATVWAYGTTDALDLYSAANANSPSWVFLSTITPSASGAQTLSTSFTLPSGGLQAIRANFRYQGSASSCSTGAYDDHDDLIFAVGGGDTTPPTVSASESGTSGTITLSATASDNVGVSTVEFYIDGSLKGTDTSSPYSMTLDSTTLTNASHSLVAKAYDAANNVGTSSTVNFTINNSSGGGGGTLTNGVGITISDATAGHQQNWTMAVPAGATGLTFTMSGGTGDADMYVKFGSAPTTSSYDCRPYVSGNNESCPIATAQAGTYYVMVNAYSAYSGVTLKGSYSTGGGGCTPSGTVLCSGSTVTGLSASTGNFGPIYSIVVPAGSTKLAVAITGSTGDADLYVRQGAAPTTSSYTCRPYLSGDNETCTINSPAAATYYIGVRAYSTYSGVTLTTTIN